MSYLADSDRVLSWFDDISGLVTSRGNGITMRELAAAHELARLLESCQADSEGRVNDLCAILAIDPQELK